MTIKYELALFAGAGGGILGGKLLGWKCIGAVECENYPRGVLAQRQNDGHLDPFPIWDDVRTFRADNPDCAPYIEWLRSIRNELVITGGFPCQDISAAGKGAGIEGERSGLWREMARIIGEIRPARSFVENSPMLTVRGIRRVLGDLAEMGYDAQWGVVSAADAIWLDGTPCLDHLRDRLFIAASDADGEWKSQSKGREQNERRRAVNCGQADADASSERYWLKKKEIRAGRIGAEPCRATITHSDSEPCEKAPHSTGIGQSGQGPYWYASDPAEIEDGEADRTRAECIERIWGIESAMGRVVHGVGNRLDRLKAIGNGQVPRVVKLAWEILDAQT